MKTKRKPLAGKNATSATAPQPDFKEVSEEVINSTFNSSINGSDNANEPIEDDQKMITEDNHKNEGVTLHNLGAVPSLTAKIDLNLLTEATKAKIFKNAKHLENKANNGQSMAKMQLPISKLVESAIRHLNERSGSSIIAISKFILSNNPDMDSKQLSMRMKRYVKKSLKDGQLVQVKRSFKLSSTVKNSKTDAKKTLKRKANATQEQKTKSIENAKVAKVAKDAKDVKGAKHKMVKNPTKQPKIKQNKVQMPTTEATSNKTGKKPKNPAQDVAKTSNIKAKENPNGESVNSKQFAEKKGKQKKKLVRRSISMLTNPVPSKNKTNGIEKKNGHKIDAASASKTESKGKKKK